MISCPKCSSYRISGPRYESSGPVETLRYQCDRCGYSQTTPTDDNRRSEFEAIQDIVRRKP